MKSRIWILVFILGIAAVAFGWVYESRLRSKVETAELIIPDNIDYFLTRMNYRAMNEAGRLDFQFTSPRLEHYPRGDVSLIETPSLQIHRDSGIWRVDARQGEFQHRDNLLRLRRQVVLQKTGPQPLEMLTESIRFEPDRNLVSSEASVLLTSRQARIEAERAVFDINGKVYRLTRARAIYYREDG